MATIYVRSTDGDNADDGSTWALAKLDLAGAAAIDSAGDTIFVSDAHAESTAATITVSLAGTAASPVRIICGDDAAEPPTATATTGTVTTTAGSSINIRGSCYVYGIAFYCGTGTNASNINLGNITVAESQVYEECEFRLNSTWATNNISCGENTGNSNIVIFWKNCDVRFVHASQYIAVGATFFWHGGAALSGTTTPTALINPATRNFGGAYISGVDLSGFSAGVDLCFANWGHAGEVVFRDCKLPASWSGTLFTAAATRRGCRAAIYNCAAGDTNYEIWVEDYSGSIVDETTIVRTGGASDGTTTLSWEMTTTANASETYPLYSPEIHIWNDTTGAAKTVTVEIVHDSVTNIQDDEIWLEVMYLGTSGFPLGTWIDDARADVLATAADQTDSSETWTTTGLTNPNTQKLSVSFTPQEKGYFVCRVALGKPSYTVYVDPKVTVS